MKKILMIFFTLILSFQIVFSEDKIVYFTSLEWAPYTGEKLSSQGMSTLILQKAFEAEGYKIAVNFYPWERAVDTAKNKDKFMGYFPEYYSKDIEGEFYFSDPIGEGPLGFVERKDNSIKWNKLDELKKYKIGTVRGYVNTEEFDKMAANKEMITEEVTNDLLNIRKVAGKRMPLAVIDKNVLEYYLNFDVTLTNIKNEVQFNPTILENKKIYVCFKKSEEGKKYMEILNRGLKKIDIKKIEEEYKQIVFGN